MNSRWGPFLRLGLAAVIIAMLFSMPLREFMKITVFAGVPFFLVIVFMRRRPRHVITRIAAAVLLLALAGGYGYMLTNLPQRIEEKAVKQIIGAGTSLEAAGDYAAAIEKYRELEKYGRTDIMQTRINEARQQESASAMDGEEGVR